MHKRSANVCDVPVRASAGLRIVLYAYKTMELNWNRTHAVCVLQVSLTTFFGDTKSFGEGVTPNSLCVGGHNMGFMPCDFKRSLIDGIPIQISTTFPAAGEAEQAAVPGQARHFGTRKCEDGTAVGRWVWMGNSTSESVECVPPFCTGNLSAGVTAEDLVSCS